MPSIFDLFGGANGGGPNPLASIFDQILGRQAAGPSLPGMPDPQRQASSNDPAPPSMLGQNLLGGGMNLLAAGGPTTQPMDFGDALSGAMGRGNQGQWPLRPRSPWGMR